MRATLAKYFHRFPSSAPHPHAHAPVGAAMDPTVLERLSRRPVRTAEYVEPRADINRYRVGSSNTAARGRPLANPSSAVRSEPAWSFSIEERPKAGKPSAWKMEQPREGVRHTRTTSPASSNRHA